MWFTDEKIFTDAFLWLMSSRCC